MNHQSYYHLRQHKGKKKKSIRQGAGHYLFNEGAAEITRTSTLGCSLPMTAHLGLLQACGRVQWSQVNKILQFEQPHHLQWYMEMSILMLSRLFDHNMRLYVQSQHALQFLQYVDREGQGSSQTPKHSKLLPTARLQTVTDQQDSLLISHVQTSTQVNSSLVGTNIKYTNNPHPSMSVGGTDPPKPPFPSAHSNNIVYGSFDHNGGVFHSKDGITLTIPNGAIKYRDVVKFTISMDLCGPFVFPSNYQGNVVSPIFWIRVSDSYYFHKSIQVKFEYFGACDPSHYQLLCCEDEDESYNMQPVDYNLEFEVRGEMSWCTFQTHHFCSYCLYHCCEDPVINRIGVFYLKPKHYECLNQFTVEVWFSFPISHCLKRNEELYAERDMVLDSSYIFEASSDKNSENFFTLWYTEDITGWYLGHSRSTKIPTKEVNFYNYYTNVEELEAVEAKQLYPPRFIVSVAKNSQCATDLHTNITVSLHDHDRRRQSNILFNLFVLIYTKASIDSSSDTSLFFIDSHHCEENKPIYKDLELYLEHISSYWRKIAIYLGISRQQISVINIDNSLMKDKCSKMLRIWLEKTISPCWCHFIEALIDCRLHDVAEAAKKHFHKSPSKVMGSPDTDKGRLCIKELQKSPTNVKIGSPDTSEDSLYTKEEIQKSSVEIDDRNKANIVAMKKPEPVLTSTDTITETGNHKLTVNDLMQLSADLEAINPLKDSEVMFHTCDYNGGILMSKDDSMKITVPKGAIKKEDLVLFATTTNLFASFILPSKCHTRLASPYYWIGVTGLYHFQTPVEVGFQHFGACDPTHYQLLCCEDDDESFTMQPVDCKLSFKIQGGTFWCTFQAPKLCSYCLHHGCSHPMINKIGVYYLKPKNFQSLDFFMVEIWFSFPISHCSERNRKLFSNRNMILDAGCSYIFEASCEESSGTYFSLEYAEKVDGWQIDHSLSKKIPTKRVNFYKYYTNAAELEASEEDSSFPPRFIVNVVKNYDCTTNLNTNFTVTVRNNEDKEVDSIKFKLFVPLSEMITRNSTNEPVTKTKDCNRQTSLAPVIGHHHCDNNRPELRKLSQYSAELAPFWKEIALHLEIPECKVKTIDIDHHNVENKCNEMFSTWLLKKVCWCHLIQALYACDVGLQKVAEEVKLNLKYDSTSVASPDINHDLHQRTIFLKDIPEYKLNYFITRLLPKASAAAVIKDIRCSRGSKEDNINKVCEEFLKQEDSSWTKIHKALNEAKCDELADSVETCFL